MKRLPVLLAVALMLTLAACGDSQPVSPELEGSWSGSATSGTATLPVSFDVGRNGQVEGGTFNASYESELLSFTVNSEATGRTILITATATNNAGHNLLFVLDGLIDDEDRLVGQFRLDIIVNGTTTSIGGTFSLQRVDPR